MEAHIEDTIAAESIETVHVVFSPSTAGSLRKALKLLGSGERVIGLPDSLSVGPISPPDRRLRQAWGRSALYTDFILPNEFDGNPIEAKRTWDEATSPSVNPVFWACLSSPAEHACFLAFAARMQNRTFHIIDATNLDFTTSDGIKAPWALGLMRPKDFVASRLHQTRRLFSPAEIHAASVTWSELCRENAPFRIVRDGRLVSAPLTHYDALLVDQASQEWEIAARLIGRVMTKLFQPNLTTGYGAGDSAGDVVLFGRMFALGKNGSLSIAGAGPGMRDYQVCRPAT